MQVRYLDVVGETVPHWQHTASGYWWNMSVFKGEKERAMFPGIFHVSYRNGPKKEIHG